jgi:hypothetical protein
MRSFSHSSLHWRPWRSRIVQHRRNSTDDPISSLAHVERLGFTTDCFRKQLNRSPTFVLPSGGFFDVEIDSVSRNYFSVAAYGLKKSEAQNLSGRGFFLLC